MMLVIVHICNYITKASPTSFICFKTSFNECEKLGWIIFENRDIIYENFPIIILCFTFNGSKVPIKNCPTFNKNHIQYGIYTRLLQ